MATTVQPVQSVQLPNSKWLWQVITGQIVVPQIAIADGSGGIVNSFGGSGGTAMTDDTAFTPATSSVTPAGAIYRSALDNVDDGDVGAIAMLANRILMVHSVDSSGVALAPSGGGTQYAVDAALGSTPTGTLAVAIRDDALSALTPVEGDGIGLRVDANGALWVIPSGTVTVSNAGLTELAAAIDTELQVDVVGALPAGTNNIGHEEVLTLPALPAGNNNIGDVDIASIAAGDNNIGNVDVLSLIPGTAATNLGKAEDAVHSSGDTGVMALAVQKATPADLGADGDYGPLQVSAGRLWVDPSGVTLTVASHAVTNAGTFAVQATIAAGAAAIAKAEDVGSADADVGVPAMAVRKATPANTSGTDGDYEFLQMSAGRLWVDPSGVTLTVASHAVTNAGTFLVQENGSWIQADDAAFTPATSKVAMIGAEFDDSSPDSVDEGDGGAVRMSGRRELYTQLRDAAGNERGANVNASNQLAVAGPVTNAGTFAVQVDGNALTSLQLIDDPVIADDAAFTPATSKVMMAGFEADESSPDSVDEGDAGAARMTLTRKLYSVPQAHTAGGATPFKNLDVDESEDAIKATAGQLYSLTMINLTASVIYCKLYNDTVANVVVGTTVPVQVFAVPANNDTDGAGISLSWPVGLAFDTAITIAATTGVADNDTGAPAANALVVSGSFL